MAFNGSADKAVRAVKVPDAVTIDGITYRVTAISDHALSGCKKLKSITIKTAKLKSKSVGTQPFKGIHKKAAIKVPKKQKKSYKTWLKKKGLTGSAIIK